MKTGLTHLATIRRVRYRITYEKINPLGPLGGDGETSHITLEARNLVEATMQALDVADVNERVKAVEGPA